MKELTLDNLPYLVTAITLFILLATESRDGVPLSVLVR